MSPQEERMSERIEGAARVSTPLESHTLQDVLQEVVQRHPCGPMTRLGHGVAAAHYRCSVCGFRASGPDSVTVCGTYGCVLPSGHVGACCNQYGVDLPASPPTGSGSSTEKVLLSDKDGIREVTWEEAERASVAGHPAGNPTDAVARRQRAARSLVDLFGGDVHAAAAAVGWAGSAAPRRHSNGDTK